MHVHPPFTGKSGRGQVDGTPRTSRVTFLYAIRYPWRTFHCARHQMGRSKEKDKKLRQAAATCQV